MKTVVWNEAFGTGGTLHCTCDNCGKAKDFKFKQKPDYRGAHEKLKAKGWFPKQLRGKWYDFCSDQCKEDFEEELDE